MGLPGFFSYLLKNYKNKILLKQINKNVDYFYIDANCLFHPECAKIKEHFLDLKNDELEKHMMTRIKNYLMYLYNFVDAKKCVGTMVDGVCPLAKMSQQRKRRFKSVDDNKVRNNLKKKHGKAINEKWSNTVITPGTEFMEKLHIELVDFFKNKIANKTEFPKYIYSSYHTPGEGEHNILQHIKNHTNVDDVVVIYGLDADLIFLAMTSGMDNIYLLRESLHFGIKHDDNELYDPVTDVAQELMYVSIQEVKKAFNNQLLHLVRKKENIHNIFSKLFDETIDFSNDFVVICFLLGNDFLPHFPSIDIYKGGLDSIIDSYIDALLESKTLLITKSEQNDWKINTNTFLLLCEKLGNKEEKFFREGIPFFNSLKNKKTCMLNDDYSKELWNLENLKIFKINDPVKLGHGLSDDWKFRYYEHHFGVVENQKQFIENLIMYYLEGIIWVTKYYFDSCPSWSWHYPYDHGPFISDIAYFLLSTHFDINNIKFKYDKPLDPMKQLLTVLPPSSSDLLANSYKKYVVENDSPIIDMYPKKTKLDMLNKDQYWQCIPKLPPMNVDRIIDAIKNEKLTKNEKIRNQFMNLIEF